VARILLERAGDEPVYQATLIGDREWRGEARVAVDGTVSFAPWQPPDAPAWLVEHARAFLRVEWRARQVPDPAPWPARINRWRAPSDQ